METAARLKHIILTIGDVIVVDSPAVLETVLGSCVSVCLMDETAGIGGMNHILLPEMVDGLINPYQSATESIDRLVKVMETKGARLQCLKAKVFGGGHVVKAFGQNLDIGRENFLASKEALRRYGIPVTAELHGNNNALKIFFDTGTGTVAVKRLEME